MTSLNSATPRLCTAIAVVMICIGAPIALADTAQWNPDAELIEIQEMIEANGWDWQAGSTDVWRYTPEQKQVMLGTHPVSDEKHREMANGDVVPLAATYLPTNWDWREMDGMTPVKDQGACGSCWAFAATAAFEAMIRIYTGVTTDLSEQQILVCNDNDGNCYGGYPALAFWLQKSMGQIAESHMPYTADDSTPCVHQSYSSVERNQGYLSVANTPNSLKTAVMNGPITVNIYAPDAMFAYTGGCFEYDDSGAINHSVCLCGWDDDACGGQGAWLIKNSWGTGWGESGYAWIRYGDLNLGQGACQVDYSPSLESRLGYHAVEVLGGNGNGILDPGETATLRITIRNYGRETGTSISATLSCLRPEIEVTGASASFPDIGTWDVGSSSTPDFEVSVAPEAEGPISFVLMISCAEENDHTSRFPLFIGPVEAIYEEGFEIDDGGWSHGGSGDDWQRAIPRQLHCKPDPYAASEGSFCFGNDVGSGGIDILYDHNADNYLQSPIIDCSEKEGVHLAFRRWLTVEEGVYDDARLLVSGTEVFLNESNRYTFDTAWQEIIYDISLIADDNPFVQLRFELESDTGLSFGGWAIDDVRIFAPPPLTDAAPLLAGVPPALSIRPLANPFIPGSSLRLAVPVPGGRPDLRVFDPSGRCVKSFDTEILTPGFHTIAWSGRDSAHRPPPTGVYFMRALLGSESVSSRVVLLR